MTSWPDTIVLIHGPWMKPIAWERWADRYQARGFTVLTPEYPEMSSGVVSECREEASKVSGLGVDDILDHLSTVIENLPTPPIIMGHSIGGTLAQLLIGNGLGAAGVSIAGGPVRGMGGLPLSKLRSILPILNDFSIMHQEIALTIQDFRDIFANCLEKRASQWVYDRYVAPTPARIIFQSGLAPYVPHAATAFDFYNNDRAPLFFISGEQDQIFPAVVQRRNYEMNAMHSTAIAAYAIFDGRDHFIFGEPGWESIADTALAWSLAPRAGTLQVN
ncbi:alpha/beta hydrolase [Streptomyces sp. NPDC094468]|uniref:alpha/beta hydrolase n=1 Tax=Streptomyces sp. NPDC094468 TaxID=3366066 RepID=UPI0038029A04